MAAALEGGAGGLRRVNMNMYCELRCVRCGWKLDVRGERSCEAGDGERNGDGDGHGHGHGNIAYHSFFPCFQRGEVIEGNLAPAGGGEPAPVGDVWRVVRGWVGCGYSDMNRESSNPDLDSTE